MATDKVHTDNTQMSRRSESSSTRSDKKTLSTEPVTDEMFKGALNTAKESSSNSKRSIRMGFQTKPTILYFGQVIGEANVAKNLFVLCNISDRVLHFRLKSSAQSNIVALPFGNGHIAPHSQVRLELTWSKLEQYNDWEDIPSSKMPKLILTTRFLDVKEENVEITHTRLLARLNKKPCMATNPPVEQLLLDAAKALQEERLDDESRQEANMGKAMADFINNISDRGIFALFLILAIVLLLVGGSS